MDIKKLQAIAKDIFDDYRKQANGTRRWLQDYRKETQAYQEYRGREIFELLQNADDANSDKVDIMLDKSRRLLTVTNSGDNTIPFTEDGIQSIMLSDLSPKKGKKMIGAKGLGFRSVLNWTDKIEIHSENVSLRFGNDIVIKQWNELKKEINDAERFELEAKKDDRIVPLAILALPEITEIHNKPNTTSIVLTYDLGFEQGIINDLNKFQPESLLFLHSIKQVNIIIDGIQTHKFSKDIIKEQEGYIETKLNGNHWIQSTSKGILDNNDYEYEVSCAFCLDSPKESYNIFSFFPTQVEFPIPCILHATLELDSSRNALLPGNKNNYEMMDILINQVNFIAEHLKEIRHNWYPYLLMHPDTTKPNKNEYVSKFVESISHLASEHSYIPTLNNEFVREDEYYYYTDQFYNQVCDGVGKDIFSRIRLNNAPKYADLKRQDPDMINHINTYALQIVSDIDLLSNMIVSLLDLNIRQVGLFNILRDSDLHIIEGAAYVNTGMEVDGIPSFREINYVDEKLVSVLREKLNLHGKEPDRDLVSRLKLLTDISATDVSVVTRNLLPKQSDKSLSLNQKEELLVCLYKLFIKRNKDNFSKPENVPYLMSESGEWVPSNKLVMTDRRFPNGFDKLELSFHYESRDCVMYPEFLEKVEGSTSIQIQDFFIALGVNAYFKTSIKFYGNDTVYLNQFNLPVEVLDNCKSWRVDKSRNSTRIADSVVLSSLSLQDLIKVLSASSYIDDICGNQQIDWFLNCYKTPQTVDISYAAFKLRKDTQAKQLQFYAIDDDEWLPGEYLKNKPKFNLDYKTKNLLEKLGAKKHLSDFSSEDLYNAINQQEHQWKFPYVGAQAFYHTIKQALDSKENSLSLPKEKTLRLLCKINENYEFKDSRDIYYSDNNELPEDILRSIPMLVMGRREGEQKIKRLFGCKTLKDIQIHIKNSIENDILTRELCRHIEKLKPYILAFASVGVGRRGGSNANVLYNDDIKRLLTSFHIIVVESADYSYDLENQNLLELNSISMSNGELLCVGQKFYICAENLNLQEAMRIPEFINSVIEALCIKLNLSSSDIANRFYRVFTSNNNELEFYRKQEIEDSLWHECENQFGMAATDVDFWKKVFAVNQIKINESLLRTKKTTYLLSELKIDLDRVSSPDNFILYHKQQLEKLQMRYLPSYVCFIYNKIKDEPSLHHEYLQRQTPFKSDSWLKDILYKDDNIYQLNIEYERLMLSEMQLRFDYKPTFPLTDNCPTIKESYLKGIDKFNLDDESKSLLYFEGYDDFFKNLCNKENNNNNVESSTNLDTEDVLPILECTMNAKNPPIDHGINIGDFDSHEKKNQKRKISNSRKAQLGNEAEKRVYDSLLQNSDYEVGNIYSSYLANYASKGNGDDSKGYDLEYRKEGETFYRCLEIKYSDGESIILSGNEYEVSQRSENKARYDLALVTNNDIRIIRNAFADSKNYNKIANDYTVYFKTSKV